MHFEALVNTAWKWSCQNFDVKRRTVNLATPSNDGQAPFQHVLIPVEFVATIFPPTMEDSNSAILRCLVAYGYQNQALAIHFIKCE